MDSTSIFTILISILSSSIFTLILSTLFFDPFKDRKKYIFEEKQRVYESIITFAQIALYPKEAKFSLGVARYNIAELSEQERIKNAVNDLKMSIPKLQLITNNPKVIKQTMIFIEQKDETSFSLMIDVLRKDLFK
ncbi:hypothetical protein IW492_13905 [Enterococcus sp. BWB1-3]|uniref:hypothetical protein n=1 Tax=unclassified Enterococcus TaxID=2608891 RepID=UPI00192041F2|nr:MULTISPECIES: hypothetical protein [unclassified Enterococcus]MBL1230327.1 hypothetical protein [Enterococcus sp. BWB1-3]MCB5951356.1 hypothetical protein [Enterococcus sp. BWT-B8]